CHEQRRRVHRIDPRSQRDTQAGRGRYRSANGLVARPGTDERSLEGEASQHEAPLSPGGGALADFPEAVDHAHPARAERARRHALEQGDRRGPMSGERDPLADLVSRSVGRHIESVAVEALPPREGIERKRLRYDASAGPAAAIFERSPRGEALEAQLLPFLARKTDRVPIVHARGIPPA